MVLLVSDWHVGRLTSDYAPVVFKERLENLFSRLYKHKRRLNRGGKIDGLHILMLGDIIDGEGIYYQQPYESPFSAEEMIDYTMDEFGPMLERLENWFHHVSVSTVNGNHGRANRYRQSNWDSVLYKRLRDVYGDTVDFSIGGWKNTVEVEGVKILMIHGDGINMYQNIPFYGITQRLMRYQTAGIDFSVLTLGHFHTSFWYNWNGLDVVGNGTFLSSDEFIMRRLGLKPDLRQWMFTVDNGEIGWRYAIPVD